MKAFVDLFESIDRTKSTKEKIQIIQNYFDHATSQDAAWALYLLSGNKLKRLIGSPKLIEWCQEALSLPSWLIAESYAAVGDAAETVALLMAPLAAAEISIKLSLSEWIENRILPLYECDLIQKKEKILEHWRELDTKGIFILNKILTGSLRVGVSELLTLQALSKTLGISREVLSLRLMGSWTPNSAFYESLKAPSDLRSKSELHPYPFFLASPVQEPLEDLGNPDDWLAEWKWDGIRAQCIHRGGSSAIWSRGNELISVQFPEIIETLNKFDDGIVFDGEILAYQDLKPLPFSELQKRLGRKKVSIALLQSVPVVFMIYDLLEYQHQDLRKVPFNERREMIEQWQHFDSKIRISPIVTFETWDELRARRKEAESNATEGLILKKKSSHYGVGRRRGNWWKFKIDPKTIDVILIYAQTGQGMRANLYTDYTFGVWNNEEIVPIAKAYSGLSRQEIKELDRWIRKNTEEKFGPVRRVKPELVFELAFEGIQKSPRHKSQIALRFPRIVRWRHDKSISECDTLEGIKSEFHV